MKIGASASGALLSVALYALLSAFCIAIQFVNCK